MVKLFGLRFTPFFLFILGLECLALLVSLYIGIVLYQDTSASLHTVEFMSRTIYSDLFLILLLSILTPGFYYQTRVLNHVKKSINEKALGFTGALMTMLLILYTNTSDLSSKTLFVAGLLSAFVGLVISQTNILCKYWRLLIRSGVN